MIEPAPLARVVNGVEEALCWRFVHGRAEPTYQPATGVCGPFDPDRRRHLKLGETFQRLDRSGHPCTYQGLSWQPKVAIQPPPAPAAASEDP